MNIFHHSFDGLDLAEKADRYSNDILVDVVWVRCWDKKEADLISDLLRESHKGADMSKIVLSYRAFNGVPWIEARYIAEWWIDKARERARTLPDYYNIDTARWDTGAFVHTLARIIFRRDGEYPTFFGTGYGPDRILSQAADIACIPGIAFPVHTIMKVRRDGSAKVACGYREPFVDLR